ncbi:ASKHA domain-containing protein [Candidatus Bipolaricaulota sp. J31]
MESELTVGKGTVEVVFHPDGRRVRVERGETLLAAARAAGVPLLSICGGEGICGRCRVIVRRGKVEAAPTLHLSREEITRGYVLACQARVWGDVEVEVPPESREEMAARVDRDARGFLAPEAEVRDSFGYKPLVQKLFLELPPPTLEDNTGDQERLFREVRRRVEAPILQAGLKVLRGLPPLLREAGWQVTVTLAQRGGTVELLQVEPGDRARDSYGVAVDVGTSTVVAHLLDLRTGKTLAAEARYNSQRNFGEEVTRRIVAAERKGVESLQEAVVEDINGLIALLVEQAGVKLQDVLAVMCAGNTAMAHFLLGFPPHTLRKSPYVAAALAPPPVRAAEVGIRINPRGLLYVVPGIGGWVGGDITAGLLATGLYRAREPFLFIDIGTNGEVVLGDGDWMVAASASAGPAFEGAGVTCGMRAARGAIHRVEFTPQGVRYRTVGDEPPRGLCGSGIIDAVAGLFRAGYIDRSGRLDPSRPGVVEWDGELAFVLVPRDGGHREVVVTQRDIENVLRAKAAIYAAVSILLREMGLEPERIKRIYVAGAFGSHIDPSNAVALGLVPDLPGAEIVFVGNTSLAGAKLCLFCREAFAEAERLARRVTYYDLINCPYYYEEFMAAKFLPHTDLSRFPTVARALKLGEPV